MNASDGSASKSEHGDRLRLLDFINVTNVLFSSNNVLSHNALLTARMLNKASAIEKSSGIKGLPMCWPPSTLLEQAVMEQAVMASAQPAMLCLSDP